ncbi:hypothetical protein PPRY_b0939 [Pseudoalteromonas prydzensis ACAM 620]|nr:hypothetical protein [Pseudoalteromonas prydzensis ACAM 620]
MSPSHTAHSAGINTMRIVRFNGIFTVIVSKYADIKIPKLLLS